MLEVAAGVAEFPAYPPLEGIFIQECRTGHNKTRSATTGLEGMSMACL
jgi:hypothetical protein